MHFFLVLAIFHDVRQSWYSREFIDIDWKRRLSRKLKKSASTPSLPESETGNMNVRTMQNSSAFSANVDNLSSTPQQFESPSPNLSVKPFPRYGITVHYIVVSVNIGLVIFGTIGNIMTLAVFRMYQRSSKSSATFLMQALCVVDTLYLLCLVPTEWMYKYLMLDSGKTYMYGTKK